MSWDSEERRQFVRVSCPCKITVTGHRGNPIFIKTENISAGGIRVLAKERISPSSIIDLEIHIQDGKSVLCKGKVIWEYTRKVTSSGSSSLAFDTGIEFHDIKDEDVEAIKKFVVSTLTGKA